MEPGSFTHLRIQLQNYVSELDRLNALLKSEIIEPACIDDQAVVFHLPFPSYENVPELIEVAKEFSSRKSRYLAIDALTRRSLVEGQLPTLPFRLPGAVAVSDGAIKTAAAINEVKKLIKPCVQAIPKKYRAEMAHQTIPGVMLLQMYRYIPLIERNDVKAIRFSWAAHGSSIRRLTKAEVVESLSKQIQSPPAGTTRDIWADFLAREIACVNSCPDNEYAIKRIVQPHPRCNTVSSGDGGRAVRQQFKVSLPILYPNSNRNVEVTSLGDCDLSDVKQKRCDAIVDDHPLVERIGLYRYLPGS